MLKQKASNGTLLNADVVQEIAVVPKRNDIVDIIRGVVGSLLG